MLAWVHILSDNEKGMEEGGRRRGEGGGKRED